MTEVVVFVAHYSTNTSQPVELREWVLPPLKLSSVQ